MGGPLKFLGRGATLFADILAQGMLDADVRGRGLTCLTEDDAGDDVANAVADILYGYLDPRIRYD